MEVRVQVVAGAPRSLRLGSALLVVLLSAFTFLAVPLAAPATAHTSVEGTTPRDGATVPRPPALIEVTFTDPVTPSSGQIEVRNSEGERVDSGSTATASASIAVSLKPVDDASKTDQIAGTLQVRWRVLAADGHPRTGEYSFNVGRPSVAPQESASLASPPSLKAAAWAARILGYLGLSCVVGAIVWWLMRLRIATKGALDGVSLDTAVMKVGALALILSAATALALRGATAAGHGWAAVGDGVLIADAVATTAGRAELTRIMFAVTLLAVLRLSNRLDRSGLATAAIGTTLAITVTYGLTGHGADGSAGLTVSTLLHVMAATTWAGGVGYLAFRAGGVGFDHARGGTQGQLLVTFHRVMAGAAVVLAGTGLIQAVAALGAVSDLVETAYGWILVTKVVVVAGVLSLAVQSSVAARSSVPDPYGDRRAVLREVAAMVLVFGLTAALATTSPAG